MVQGDASHASGVTRTVPRVSVVVVSYNRKDDLRLCLEAIFASTYPELEVVIVDNASTDGAVDVAASFSKARVLRSAENTGFAGGANQGLELCTGEYVALVNSDAVIDPRWIEELVSFLETKPEAAAAGGRQFFWDDTNPLGNRSNRFLAFSVMQPDGSAPPRVDNPIEIREVGLLSGSNVMIRRRAIDDVGLPLFEPLFFMYYEETDFFARAIRKGWRLFYVGAAACWHHVKIGAPSASYAYHYYVHRNRLLFAYRHFDDAGLERVVGLARRRATAARVLRGLRGGIAEPAHRKAHRDAWAWAEENSTLLREHRARHARSGRPYEETLRLIEDRGEYYGHARPEVAALVPANARFVVDIGCGGGGLGRALRRSRPDVEVRGIEPVPEAAALARTGLNDVVVGTAEDPMPEHWPRPDCVIFADVLEHLVDPASALEKWRAVLAPGGALIASIPNVGHHSVVRGLLRGRWDYQERGILDRTHLRFFTRANAVALIEQAGFRVERLERVERPPPGILRPLFKGALALSRNQSANPKRIRHPGSELADFGTSQYVILAR